MIVSILSYIFFREKITPLNGVGMIFIIVATVFLGIFGPDQDKQIDVLHPADFGQDAGKSGATALVVLYGCIAAIFSALECIVNKYLMNRCGVPGDISGITFQLFEGIIGTICLIILSVNGKGVHEFDSGKSFAIVMIAGACAFTALTVLNYAVAVGNAAVAISLFNCSAAVHVIIASVFLDQ